MRRIYYFLIDNFGEIVLLTLIAVCFLLIYLQWS